MSTALSLPRLAADATAEEVSATLLAHGAVIIERLLDDATCERLASELAPWLELTPVGADDFSGRTTRRTGGLLTKCPTSAELVAHPLVLDAVDCTLWPQKTTFQLHLTQSIAIGPGGPPQVLHRDHWCFYFFPFPRDVDVEVSTIWALTDFVEENGATRVVPDSHRTPNDTVYTPADSLPAEMPRGSVVMYLGSTVHGGGENRSGEVRIGVNIDYVLGWLRQEENQYLTYTLDEVRAMPERIQRLLGYEPGAYALGYVDGGRSPMTILSGEISTESQSFRP